MIIVVWEFQTVGGNIRAPSEVLTLTVNFSTVPDGVYSCWVT